MTTHTLRTVIVAAAITLMAAATSAQQPAPSHGQKFVGPMHQSQHGNVTEQVSRLDERIATLKADMRMFAGEMKIQVMTELIEALIDRQYLIERSMRPMREMMDEWLPRTERPHSPHAMPDPEDAEPEAMCSPYI